MPRTRFDLVAFGATGFVGRILARALLERHGAGARTRGKASERLKWAIAARSARRLSDLRDSLGPDAAGLPSVVADATDERSLRAMCAQARVVISTVGPYAVHGAPLVGVCAQTGTDYCDLTGEVQWVRKMIERHEQSARASGARVVHCCGFDSIPSDLGVLLLQRAAIERYGEPCTRVKMRVRAMRGGISGGTAASLMNIVEQAASDSSLRGELADPYSLCPPGERPSITQPSFTFVRYDDDFGAWTAPFLMSGINTRIVHRSNALSGRIYGEDFRYDEAMLTGRSIAGAAAAAGVTAGIGGVVAAAALPPSRWALRRFLLPPPGDGPSDKAQRAGFFDIRFRGTTADGRVVEAKVTGDRDPGYGSSARMLAEAGACLALDLPKGTPAGGFWTPATAFGERLIDRLRTHAGLRFEVLADR